MRGMRASLAALCLAGAGSAMALGISYTTPLEGAFNALLSSAVVPDVLGQIGTQAPLAFEERKRLASMPAAKRRQSRADYMLAALRSADLENAHADAAGNVVAERLGLLHRPRLLLMAPLDAADEGRGMAALLTTLRALQARRMPTAGDLVFVALDDKSGAQGVDTVLRAAGPVDGVILVDGSMKGAEAAPPPGAAPADTALIDAARRAAGLMMAPAARLPARGSVAAMAQAAGVPVVVLSDGGPGIAPALANVQYRPAGEWKGPQALLLTTLAMVGLAGVSDPQLAPVKAPALR